METKVNKTSRLYWLMALVVLGWVLLYLGFPKIFEHQGAFGDIFNAINSLFAGLAFAGIIYTIYLQREELSLQRKELVDTRKEFEIQNQTLKKQRFESTFFNLVTLQHTITEKISIKTVASVLIGREAIHFIYGEFKSLYLNRLKEFGTEIPDKVAVENHRALAFKRV